MPRNSIRRAGGKLILDDVSLSINMGEFVALIGPSGSGKSTLLRALNGFRFADRGTVQIAGRDLYREFPTVKSFLGYVPQDDAIHHHLTVDQTFHYVARLRLPPDYSSDERAEIVERVLSELELIDHRGKYVHQLSGGQRKRVSIGVELLTDPTILFLDEPTSGLDPGMEYNLMRISRELACMGRTVVLTTHTMTNVALCDKLIFIVGGKLAFFGSPAEALRHFRVRRGEDLFIVYKDRDPEEWKQAYLASPLSRQLLPATAGDPADHDNERMSRAPGLGLFESIRQTWTLTERFVLLTLADRWNALFLLVLSPLIISLGYKTIPRVGPLMLIYSLTPLFLGVQNASKEIVKEMTVYRRERMVNLGLIPYLTSKVLILSAVAAVQVAVLIAAVNALRPEDPWSQVELYRVCVLAALAGVASGLAISAAVKTPDQANTLIPILLIAHVVGSGAFQSDDPPRPPLKAALNAVSTYWAYDELKRVAAEKVGSRDTVKVVVDALKADADDLAKQLKQVEAEREAAEAQLSEKLEATRTAMQPKEGEPSFGPGNGFPDVRAAKEAQDAMRQRSAEMRAAVDDIEVARAKLDGIVKRTRELVDRQKSVQTAIKDKELKRLSSLWFNHFTVPGENRRWIAIVAAATLVLALVLLKLQDFRSY